MSDMFQLRHTTTGGPVTSALWEKDNMPVNNSDTTTTTTTLIDKVDATYLHTLNVTSLNVMGFYQITVRNSKSTITSVINMTS